MKEENKVMKRIKASLCVILAITMLIPNVMVFASTTESDAKNYSYDEIPYPICDTTDEFIKVYKNELMNNRYFNGVYDSLYDNLNDASNNRKYGCILVNAETRNGILIKDFEMDNIEDYNPNISNGEGKLGQYMLLNCGGAGLIVPDEDEFIYVNGEKYYKVKISYGFQFMTKAEANWVDKELARIYKNELHLEGLNKADKAFEIYKWIFGNVSYGYALNCSQCIRLNNDFIPEDDVPRKEASSFVDESRHYNLSFTAYGALRYRKCVCQGFASLFYRMCNDNGVPCKVISSSATCHGWNAVQLDDNYYRIDLTSLYLDCVFSKDILFTEEQNKTSKYYCPAGSKFLTEKFLQSCPANATEDYKFDEPVRDTGAIQKFSVKAEAGCGVIKLTIPKVNGATFYKVNNQTVRESELEANNRVYYLDCTFIKGNKTAPYVWAYTEDCAYCGTSYNFDDSIPATSNKKASANEVQTNNEQHTFDKGVVIDKGSCGVVGFKKYTCTKCGFSYIDDIEPETTHMYQTKILEQPTCTKDGVREYYCVNCNTSYTVPIPKSVHEQNLTFSKHIKAPTCTAAGSDEYKCTCGATVNKSVNALGHSWNSGTITTTPTCSEMGVKTYTCKTCNLTKTESVPATGHNCVASVTKQATCTEGGITTYSCKNCNYSYTYPIAPKGHSYVGSITTKATCTENGVKTYSCKNCSSTYTEPVKATGHNYTLTTTVAPTYTEKGEAVYKCTNCGKISIGSEEEVEKLQVPETTSTLKHYGHTSVALCVTWTATKPAFAGQTVYYDVYDTVTRKHIYTTGTKATFSHLTASKQVHVYVRAYCLNPDNTKVYSNWSKPLYDSTRPTTTTVKSVRPSKNNASVSWCKQTSSTGYQIQYSKNKNFSSGNKLKTIKSQRTTNTNIYGMNRHSTYYVRVRAYKVVYGKNVYGYWSTVKKITTK